MEPGMHLVVTVETVFEGGFVASWIHPKDSRDVFRGALLETTWPSSSQGNVKHELSAVQLTPESDLANPVGVVHDHPYSNYLRRAEVIVKSVPKALLLHWNSVGSDPRRGDDLAASADFGVAARQFPHHQRNHQEIPPTTVCAKIPPTPSITAVHLFPNGDEHCHSGRRAKSLAKLRLEASFDSRHQTFGKDWMPSGSPKRNRKSYLPNKKNHPNLHSFPLAKPPTKRVGSGRAESATNTSHIPSTQPVAATLTHNSRKGHYSSESTDSSSSNSSLASSQETDTEEDTSCSGGALLADAYRLARGAPLTSSSPLRNRMGRKRAHNSLKSCTVDVIRWKRTAPSSPPSKPVND